MPDRIRGSTPDLVRSARQLRRDQTPEEAQLWAALRGNSVLPCRIRRQHHVGGFILDFYVPAAKLAIELDGSVHHQPEQAWRDASRTELLNARGIEVIRIPNHHVREDLPGVLARIETEVRHRLAQTAEPASPAPVATGEEMGSAARTPLSHPGRGAGGEG